MPKEEKPLVIAATSDLFLQSRITELASSLGFESRFAATERELAALVSPRAKLAIVDLSSTDYDPVSLTRTLKTDSSRLTVLGFYPHIRDDLAAKAKSAGIDIVVPNSSFLRTTRQILETVKAQS